MTTTTPQEAPDAGCSGRLAALRGLWAWGVLALLIAGFLALGGIEAWRDAPTYDEPVYVAAGLAALQHGDLTVNDEHPPLTKALAVLPVLAVGPARDRDLTPRAGTPTPRAEHAWAARFTRAQLAAGRLAAVTFASRLVPLIETAAVAVLLFLMGAELWAGSAAGLLAATLWLASPLTLGFGHLDGVDVSFTLAVVLESWSLLRWLRRPSRRALLSVSAAAGLTVLADADGLALAVLALVIVAVKAPRRLRSAGAVGVGVIVVIWLPYLILDPATLGLRLLPGAYVQGLSFLIHDDASGHAGFLLGMAWQGWRWFFWPLSLAVKLAPSTLALLLAAPLGWRRLERQRVTRGLVAVGAPAGILGLFCLAMPQDVSVRYLLPALALAGLGTGGLLTGAPGVLRRSVVLSAALISIALTALSFPDSLAWTDPLAGPGYRVADDADLDWGQDWYALRSWLAGHRGARVAYFGPAALSADLAALGARPLVGVRRSQVSGWLAVSATELDSVSSLAWLLSRRPVRVIDGTLLIYHVTRANPGLARPGSRARRR